MFKPKSSTKLRAISLSLLISLAGFPAAHGASSPSIYQKLGEYENTLFGQPETSQSIEKRLQNVEKQLFGKAKKGGSTADRISAIEKVMNGKKGGPYLPPIAPEMDRSEFAPTPQKAPDNPDVSANQIDRQEDAPVPADSSDRIKGILRQAMQSYSQGKTADAERLFQQVLAIDFRNSDANYNLGAIAEGKGDLNSAKRYYTAALKGSPQDQDIQDALSSVQNKLKTQTAASSPSQSSGTDPLETVPATAGDRAIAAQAAESYKKGNFDDAIQKLGYLARKNPYDASTQFALGQAFRGKNQNTEALKHLRSAATLDPKNDLYVKSLNDAQSQADDQQTASAGGSGGNSYSGAGGNSSAPAGNGVQPFVGLPGQDSSGSSSTLASGGDLAAVESYLRKNAGNVMIGSATSYGNTGMGSPFGGMGMGMGMPMMMGTSPGSTRLKRVVSSSLSGAAMGAMMNRGYPGGMSKGAMKGAMYGGLFGLMLGGF